MSSKTVKMKELAAGSNTRFECNDTKETKRIGLDGKPYVNVKNNIYTRQIELAPFASLVLFLKESVM